LSDCAPFAIDSSACDPIRLVADENFNGGIVRGILRERPDADLGASRIRSWSALLILQVLEWAAQEGRIVL
jgi:hypothetical protein